MLLQVELPEHLSLFCNLRSLRIRGNKTERIHDDVSIANNMRFVVFACMCCSCAAPLCNYTSSQQHEHLNCMCFFTMLYSYLQAFVGMTALRDLYLEQNLLREMPTSLTCLTTLVMMRLSANRLKSLPDVSRALQCP